MPESYKVYISSTYKDLKEQREVAARAVRALGLQTVAMEDYTSTEQKSVDKCREDVKSCDIYIGIFAFRYGYRPKGYDKSIVHLEYEAAGKAGVERLIFLIAENALWKLSLVDTDRTKINTFRDLITESHGITLLTKVHQLETKVAEALHHSIDKLKAKPFVSEKKRIASSDWIRNILPYLNNRRRQHEQLKALLDKCEPTLHQKPLVSIIHGNENECHDKFIKILLEPEFLPTLLHLPSNLDSIKIKEIPIYCLDPSKGLEGFKNDLSQSLLHKPNGTIEEMVQALNFYLEPVLIYAFLQAEKRQRHVPELIDKWIDFWDLLPDLAVGKKLLVFLCIEYKDIKGVNLLNAIRYNQANKIIRGYIEKLNMKKYANINGLVLTELCPITYDELKEWINRWAADHCNAELLRYEIDQCYKRQGMNAICMCLLADELQKLCRKTLK